MLFISKQKIMEVTKNTDNFSSLDEQGQISKDVIAAQIHLLLEYF